MPNEKWWQHCSQMHRTDSEQPIAYCVTWRLFLRCMLSVLQLYGNSMSEQTKVGMSSHTNLLTKLEQCLWIKIEFAHAGSVW